MKECSALTGTCISHSLSQKPQNPRRREKNIARSICSGYCSKSVFSGLTRLFIHMNSQLLWLHILVTCTKSSQAKSHHGCGKGSWSPTLYLRNYSQLMAAGRVSFLKRSRPWEMTHNPIDGIILMDIQELS